MQDHQQFNQSVDIQQKYMDSDSDEDEIFNYIDNAELFLNWAKKDKKVKVIQEQNPVKQGLELFDISLYKGGPLEDKLYSKRKNYRINVKRGNSVCKYQDQIFFIRRGMQKFYDLQYEYLQDSDTFKINKYHQRVKKLILGDVYNFLENNQLEEKTVTIYKLFKENGEHCQISYNKITDLWIIASKNVTILANNIQDLEKYQKERFYWAKLIGTKWFEILAGLEQEQQSKLKEEMNDYTFIGEYCGYDKKQHITVYDKIQIIFYAVVQNNSENICLPVEQALKIFQNYNLDFVKSDKVQNIDNFADFKNNLENFMKNTAVGDMLVEGEGGVVYVVGNSKNNQDNSQATIQKTLVLCKLKTTEYRIYRRLREMLKLNFIKPIGSKNQKFKLEVELEAKYYLPPKPLAYYLEIARQAFKKVDEAGQSMEWETLRYEFVTFFENIKNSEQFQKINFGQKSLNTNSKEIMTQELDQKNQKGLQIIILCPPALLNDKQIDALVHEFNIDQVNFTYREESQESNQQEENILTVMHMIPRISEKFYQNKNNFLFIFGFDKQGYNVCLDQLWNQKEEINSQKYNSNNQSLFSYLQSKNMKQTLDLFFKKAENFIAGVQELQSERILVEPIFEENKIIKKIIDSSGIQKKQNLPKQQEAQQQQKNSNIKNNLDILQTNNEKENATNLVILQVFATPGAGKSHLSAQLNNLIKKDVNSEKTNFTHFFEISTDKIRKKIMQEIEKDKQYKKCSQQELFKIAGQELPQKFLENLYKMLLNIAIGIQKDPTRKILLFLDRNNIPKKAFKIPTDVQNMTKYNEYNNEHMQNLYEKTKFMSIVPYITPGYQFENQKGCSYPFSSLYALNCIERVLNKRGEEHETMEMDDLQKVKICLKFFLDYKNFKFSRLIQQYQQQQENQQQKSNKQQEQFQSQNQDEILFDSLFEYGFTLEEESEQGLKISKKNANLVKFLEQCLIGIKKSENEFQFNESKISQFLAEFYKLGFQIEENFEQPNLDKLLKYLKKSFN